MLFLLSPAKTLDETTVAPTKTYTEPMLLEFSEQLMPTLQQLSPQQIAQLMSISDKLAILNMERFAQFKPPFTLYNAKQAIFLFKGDVYEGLDAYHLKNKEIDYIQDHVALLSGLYGVLRPLDLMQPYRLEMGTKLQNPKGKNLYEFWGAHITHTINELLLLTKNHTVINLASTEYFKSVQPKLLQVPVITPVFKDKKNGQYKIISFYAKRARGLMVKYAAQHQLKTPEELKQFDLEGYYYSEEHSKQNEWVFLREHQ
ncbi:peroxide stress protein YaaA [Neisseria sp. Ec49-e6-T10]|uniref:peroxide stress protein YaaA n=1 Tax=Neisseria sp. Ec49-e6-T10 TaxID=3140744 RepID=UPI003EBCCB58